MMKTPWNRPDEGKPKPLPQGHPPRIGRKHKIELHGLISLLLGPSESIFAHGAANPSAMHLGIYHESSIGDVGSEARLIRFNEKGNAPPSLWVRQKNLTP